MSFQSIVPVIPNTQIRYKCIKVTKDSFFSSEVAMNEHSRHFLPMSNQPGIRWFLLKWRPGLLPSQIYRTRMYSLTLLRWIVLKQPR
jgi:hypothetical protein